MAIFASFVHCLPNILSYMATRQLSGDTTVNDLGHISRSLDCFTSNFKKRCLIRQKLLWTTNRKSYTSFRLVPLMMTLKAWSIFEGHFSLGCHFPRPFQQSLACVRVAQSPSNSWDSCLSRDCLQMTSSSNSVPSTNPQIWGSATGWHCAL